jgi:cyclopropane fatty-acyl-phospholipid synthase-like methyltransferase
MESLVQKIFHFICAPNYKRSIDYNQSFNRGIDEAKEFFDRFDGKIDVKLKTVLDIGSGLGSNCIYMAKKGAARVVGIDINESAINVAKLKLTNEYKSLSNTVEFRLAGDTLNEKFDIVISKDSFEHYANPETFIITMKQYLNQGGIMVIGFSALWQAPYGGHIDFMTKVPWAHLMFPETVIMHERRRFRLDEDADSFEHVIGGLNKMNLKRYLNIIRESDLEIEYFKTNLPGRKPIMVLLNVLRHLPFCQEYFTQNVYSVMHQRVHP